MNPETFLEGRVQLFSGDSREALTHLPENSVDACVTDPPYSLVSIINRFGKDGSAPAKSNGATGVYRRASAGFMQARWDTGEVAFDPDFWAAVLRILKPGGHVLAMGGTRTFHHLAMAIEDAGFEVRDCVSWNYGSGFPKSHNVSKGIDRAAGAEREVLGKRQFANGSFARDGAVMGQHGVYGSAAGNPLMTAPATDAAREWEGWGTALKPAMELVCLARKPLSEGTVAANVLRWGTGALNIDGCRVASGETITTHSRGTATQFAKRPGERTAEESGRIAPQNRPEFIGNDRDGRWPANVIHDGSEEVVAVFPANLKSGTGSVKKETSNGHQGTVYGRESRAVGTPNIEYGDEGSASPISGKRLTGTRKAPRPLRRCTGWGAQRSKVYRGWKPISRRGFVQAKKWG
jgi:hypothetical protein